MKVNSFYNIPVKSEHSQAVSNESVVWTGKSSQLVNLKSNILCLLLIVGLYIAAIKWYSYLLLGIPLIAIKIIYDWYFTFSAKYVLTNQRLIRKSGVLNVVTFEIELYRVKDALLFEPLLLRLVSLGNIYLSSSQRSTHNFTIEAVPDAGQLREIIRRLVETRRSEKGVGEFDASNYSN
jgi:Bacterial PH domain